jgi:hypothetical protein
VLVYAERVAGRSEIGEAREVACQVATGGTAVEVLLNLFRLPSVRATVD